MSASKFYLLDTGIVTQLTKRSIGELKGAQAGSALEHYILMEIIAYRGLNDLEFDIHFWRTRGGYEVDFVLGDAEVGIEVKIGDSPRKTELKGMLEFQKSYSPRQAIVVCNAPKKRVLMTDKERIDKERSAGVELWPYPLFLDQLWAGKVI